MNEVKRINIPMEHVQGINENENGVNSKKMIVLLYAGERGCLLVRYLEKQLE